MSKYVNIRNNSKELLSIELIPKTQASTVRFKGAPPLNYTVNENGTVSFSLATKLIDRAVIPMYGEAVDLGFTRVDGVNLSRPLMLNAVMPSPDMAFLSMYDMAQMGIGTIVTMTTMIKAGEGSPTPSLVMYNTYPNQTITFEGYVEKNDGTPGTIERTALKSLFNDPDLKGPGLIINNEGDMAICLGVNNKPAGTELGYPVPLLDPNNDKIIGDIYLSVTVVQPGLEDVTLTHTQTITRPDTTNTWADSLDWVAITDIMVDDLNDKYTAITESDLLPFANALTANSQGAPFLIALSPIQLNAPNVFLPMGYPESLDGTWTSNGSMESSMQPMAMSATTLSESMDGSMGGSMDGSMGGSLQPIQPSPYETYPSIYITISGTPLIDVFALNAGMQGQNVDTMPPFSEEEIQDAMDAIYILQDRQLIVHTADPAETELLANLAHSAQRSSLETYGTNCSDFRILSAGILKASLMDLGGNGAPQVPPPPVDQPM